MKKSEKIIREVFEMIYNVGMKQYVSSKMF